MGIIENIISRAKADKMKIVLPESIDFRTLKATAMIQRISNIRTIYELNGEGANDATRGFYIMGS